jgi:hypothetical protein
MLENEKKKTAQKKKEIKKPTTQTHRNLSLQAQRTPFQPTRNTQETHPKTHRNLHPKTQHPQLTSNPQTTEPEPFLSYS